MRRDQNYCDADPVRSQNMKKPERIYKFQTFDQYSLRNLKNAQVYFNRPVDFNDPFDCAISKESVSHTKQDLLGLLNSYIKNGKFPGLSEFKNTHDVPSNLLEEIERGIGSAAEKFQEHYLYNVGCCCFSERNDHILMWSHYGNGHRGFCLEFDTSFIPFRENLFKVTYSNEYPKWKIASIASNAEKGFKEDDIRHLLHKYETWKYEKEWRIFHNEAKKLFGYEVGALKAVYFGLSASFTDIEIVCLILLGQNPNIKFYKAARDGKPYRLKFDKFTYTPHKDTRPLPLDRSPPLS